MIISESNRSVDVNAFAEEAGGIMKVPIADIMVAYDCKQTHQEYLLIARNALYVESMENNLVHPFILREAGLQLKDVPKIHCDDPTDDDHTIQDLETGMFIPLELDGVFSVFNTRAPEPDDLENGIIVTITPEGRNWNPYCEVYAENEASMTDNRGDILPSQYIHQDLIVEDDYPSIDSVLMSNEAIDRKDVLRLKQLMKVEDKQVSPTNETDAIISAIASEALTLNKIEDDGDETTYESMPIEQDQVRAILSSVSNTLDVATFANAVTNATAKSKFKVSVGATSIIPPDEEDDLWSNSEPISMMVDLNDLEASLASLEAQLSAVGKAAKGVSAEHLSKVWSSANQIGIMDPIPPPTIPESSTTCQIFLLES